MGNGDGGRKEKEKGLNEKTAVLWARWLLRVRKLPLERDTITQNGESVKTGSGGKNIPVLFMSFPSEIPEQNDL